MDSFRITGEREHTMSAAKNWFGEKAVLIPKNTIPYAARGVDARQPEREIRGEVVDELGPAPTEDEIKVLHETTKKYADREAAKRILEEELAKLRAENEKLRAVKGPTLRLKVSDKGAVSLYGLGRFPVTLYASQWERLLGMKGEVERFIEEHKTELSFKE